MNAMLASRPGKPDAGWVDVHAGPDNMLLADDPRRRPLTTPFVMNGTQVEVDCPAP